MEKARYLSEFGKPAIRMTKEEKDIIEAAHKEGKFFNCYVVDCALKVAQKEWIKYNSL